MNGEYKVPSMKEIEEIPWNGYSVVSTFSGGGGSCLGYRMAGFRVEYANEFVEEARKTYRLNNRTTILDDRDIRSVSPDSILEMIGKKKGEVDLFDGSPPCCSFSTAGKREAGWGKNREYSDDKVQRTDDLFFEYARILKGIQPKVFIAENVSGLTKGTARGYFNEIIEALRDCGYIVRASLLNAMYLGVPQDRRRIIFQGVRRDLELDPVFPKPFDYLVTLKDAFAGIENDPEEVREKLEEMKRYKIGELLRKIPKNPPKKLSASNFYKKGSYFNLVRESMFQPCGTICQMHGTPSAAGSCHPLEDRKFTIAELKRITSIPDDFILTGTYPQQWERLGRMVPPLMMKAIADTVKKEILDKCKTK